jgi:type VI protein secretion system component VasF
MSQNIVNSLTTSIPAQTKACQSCAQQTATSAAPTVINTSNIPTWVYVVIAVLAILLILIFLKKENK